MSENGTFEGCSICNVYCFYLKRTTQMVNLPNILHGWKFITSVKEFTFGFVMVC